VRTLPLLLAAALLPAQAPKAPAPAAPGVHVTRGLNNPESALWDATGKCWYVSNLAGDSGARDGRAFLSKLDVDGKLLEKQWIQGLDAPKGLGILGRTLYVADIDKVAVIDLGKGQMVQRIPVQGATFLNDVAIGPGGEVYVSDMERSVIYRLRQGGKVEVFLADRKLECPNGLWVDGGALFVAAWGTITGKDFATREGGRLLRVDLKTKAITPVTAQRLGNLDGLVKLGHHFYVTDYKGGKVYKVGEDGQASLWRGGFMSAADLGLDPARKLLAIPDMAAGTLTFAPAD
jgi:DNA-binding beta-propeller fold protein YncE